MNRERQSVESEIYAQAVQMLPQGAAPAAIVLAEESWHQGVVGIVASRIAEEYGCPTFLICLDGDRGKASSRSFGGFNLFTPLPLCLTCWKATAVTSWRRALPSPGTRFPPSGRRCAAWRRTTTPGCPPDGAGGGLCDSAGAFYPFNVDALEVLEPCGNGCPSRC